MRRCKDNKGNAMRDFFILWMERIVNLAVMIGAAVIVIAAIGATLNAQGGILAGIAVLVGGTLYLILMAGLIYLGLGIYANTRRTAEAVEELARRQDMPRL